MRQVEFVGSKAGSAETEYLGVLLGLYNKGIIMKKKIMQCALIGGLILFAWGFISWMVLPWHQMNFKKFKDEAQVQNVIRDAAVGSGVYVLPHCCNRTEEDHARAHQGPTMFAVVRMEGHHMSTSHLVISLLTQILGAAVITWMLLQTKIKEYQKRVFFVTTAGFLVGLLGLVPSWNWWGVSTGYTIVLWLDLIIGWFLAGLVLARLCRK